MKYILAVVLGFIMLSGSLIGLAKIAEGMDKAEAASVQPFSTYETQGSCVYVMTTPIGTDMEVVPKSKLFFRGDFTGC